MPAKTTLPKTVATPTPVVLDASAVIALIRTESGHEQVSQALLHRPCLISTVNLAEVLSYLAHQGVTDAQLSVTRADLDALGLRAQDFTSQHAQTTGELRPQTRHLGLSMGDRACLALAVHEQADVLTADRTWTALQLGLNVKSIR